MISKFLFHLIVIPSLCFSFQPRLIPRNGGSSMRMSSESSSSSGTPVTVVGGTGFVGSKVCKSLVEKGTSVTSVSKTGNIPAWCKGEPWTDQVKWIAADLQVADDASVDAAIGSPACLVSCLGVIGTDPEVLMKGNGNANCAAFGSAKRGGKLSRAVFVSVNSEVQACEENWLPEFFKGYFDGKKMAEQCALDSVDGDNSKVCFVKPTFIYGGDSFGINPPRVAEWYGSFIEELLSLGLIKVLADITPGLIKVALRPPSSVDAVADACVSAALEGPALGKVLDGTAEINEITNQPAATGLTEAIEWLTENTGKAIDWAKEEIPKKIDELQNRK